MKTIKAIYYSMKQTEARSYFDYWHDMLPNDTTNSLSTRIIFGKEKHPQSQFNYIYIHCQYLFGSCGNSCTCSDAGEAASESVL